MLGLMQDRPLALPHVFHRAEQYFGHKTIVTAGTTGETRTTVGEWAHRVRRLATVLDTLDVSADGRVATFAWNTARHLELYLAVPCTGRVLHTLNIRLFPEQLVYVANHAEDEVVFVDRSLLPLFWPLVDKLESVRHVVVLDDGADTEIPTDPRVHDYEELLAAAAPFEGRFEIADENTAAAMCYTSGTTGNPKGVVYSHRSTVLHSLITLIADGAALSERDVLLPVVPMFHANAWGLPYGALLAGTDLVFPGPNMTPQAIAGLLERHRVTVTGGVPTIWMGMLPLLAQHDLGALRTILCGGSAVPKALSEAYREAIGVPMLHAWGMTETSPIATMCTPRSQHGSLTEAERADVRARQGQAVPLVDVRLTDPATGRRVLPRRGRGRPVHRRRLAAHRRRRGRRPVRLPAARRPHQGPHQVRRRVDRLRRAGERDHGAPEGRRGRRDRDPAPEMGGTSARVRRRQARRDPHRRGGHRPPRTPRGEVVAPRCGGVHRRGAQDQRGEVLQEDAS
jgi:fatty-acyl-CoA synthase